MNLVTTIFLSWTGVKFRPTAFRGNKRRNKRFAAIHFYPGRHDLDNSVIPPRCISTSEHAAFAASLGSLPQYIGTMTLFDNTPRRSFSGASVWNRAMDHPSPVVSFENDLFNIAYFERCCQKPSIRKTGGAFVMVNAWNEWGEGMVLEPSQVHGVQFLRALRRAKYRANAAPCP